MAKRQENLGQETENLDRRTGDLWPGREYDPDCGRLGLSCQEEYSGKVFIFVGMNDRSDQRQGRPATEADIPAILEVMEAARGIMRASGNFHQWAAGYPGAEHIAADIARRGAFVIRDAESVVAYFAFLTSPEPTYARIYAGAWLDDTRPYHVIHRIAAKPDAHGIFRTIMEFAFRRDGNIRIDTHRDNTIMQHNLLKHGFSYCGIILLADGAERLAYQRIAA